MTEAELAVPGTAECVRVFPGELDQVRPARMFVARIMAACPARETLLTCVTELAANAIEHTASGDGGLFTVSVGRPRDGVAFVSVTDQGGGGLPVVREAGELAEGGRGLALVAACSSRWGYRDTPWGRTVWAEVTWPVAVRAGGAAVPRETVPRETGPRGAGTPPSPPQFLPLGGGFPRSCASPDEPDYIPSSCHGNILIPPGVA